jgi:hypothetical protein
MAETVTSVFGGHRSEPFTDRSMQPQQTAAILWCRAHPVASRLNSASLSLAISLKSTKTLQFP